MKYLIFVRILYEELHILEVGSSLAAMIIRVTKKVEIRRSAVTLVATTQAFVTKTMPAPNVSRIFQWEMCYAFVRLTAFKAAPFCCGRK